MFKFLPSVGARARREILINTLTLVVTLAAFVLFFVENHLNGLNVVRRFIPETGVERAVYNVIFAVFMFGNLTYQASRLSFFWNVRNRVSAANASLTRFLSSSSVPPIEILVPSYREEAHVIWQTLMSAALLDYADRGVVLLLDNPPNPTDNAERDLLLSARAQVEIINEMLAPIAKRFSVTVEQFRTTREINLQEASQAAARLREEAAEWLENLAEQVLAGAFGGADDHTRKFFVRRILLDPAEAHRQGAVKLRETTHTFEQLRAEFNYLSTVFQTRVSLFERKRFLNLSHAPTKAANLNSYISVMGRRLSLKPVKGGMELVDTDLAPAIPCEQAEHIEPRNADYLIILDADSFVLQHYATAMVAALESPENQRAAVMQTPYSAIPNTPHVLERAAAATTDTYYYVTEGMGFANAGFWVGASATVRKRALEDIATWHSERGYIIPAYIQDTTVIEDTGATIDLICRNWKVEHYPARLSYSATPSDFGALAVQRRRWANGGLILLPKLLRQLSTARLSGANLLEACFRLHYLVMPACISVCMLIMLIYPFDFKRVSNWIYLTIPPYLYLISRDLKQTGYRRSELFRAYALFLILLPVVLAGVRNSIIQMLLRRKPKFGRTPKIQHRTPIPVTCTVAILALFGWSVTTAYADLIRGDGLHGAFAGSNVLALGYGIVALIGLKAIAYDAGNAASAALRAVFVKSGSLSRGLLKEKPFAAEQTLLQIPDGLPVQAAAPSRRLRATPPRNSRAARVNASSNVVDGEVAPRMLAKSLISRTRARGQAAN